MSTVNLEKLSINIDQQSTLARLLAQENINVIHGNYRTAWFDPERRVLALPIWKNRGKSVYDLLTGHEVGHALFTPAKGWHDAVDDIAGAPKAYLNVLEDVRIERKIQDRYPGLRLQFKKAYKILFDEDFFGISRLNGDYTGLLVIDRINLFYKLGENVNVNFDNSIELSFVKRAYATETFEDVVALAKEIYAYQKELYKNQQPQEEKQVPVTEENAESETEDLSNDYDKPEESDTKEDQKSEEEKAADTQEESKDETQGDSMASGKKPDEAEQLESTSKDEAIKDSATKKDIDDSLEMLDAITDQAFRQKEGELVAGNELKNTMVYTLNKVNENSILVDYKTYYSQWKKDIGELPDWRMDLVVEGLDRLNPKFKKFKLDTEQAGAYMAKEFELRKAAYQYSRSSVHKTGIINTNKLHAYKYSEDIFLKSTKLANYKNHGMMMFIDFSGSMQHNIGATIRQLLNLTTFCKMVNIPYEVYAFTTRVKYDDEQERHDTQTWKNFSDCEIIPQKFNLLNLMSSRMSRSEYQEGFRMLWNLSMCWDGQLTNSYINSWNQLHSTPLNTCIAYSNDLIKKFKLKNGVQKMVTMFLTDGASDTFQVRMTEEGEKHRNGNNVYYRSQGALLRFAGNTLDVKHINSGKVTEEMLKTIKKTTDSTVLGFFISQYRNEAVSIVCDATTFRNKDKYVEQMNKNRAIIEDNVFGYDRYFGLCNKYMDIVENEFGEMVEDGASKGKLKTAFAKMTKAKRVNRILLNAFVDSIA